MDPLSLAFGAVGLGMQIFGGMGASEDAEKAAQISKQIAVQEQNINDQKQNQMELEARRTQLQNIRNNQRARAMSVAAATSQGAQFGSGLQGGLAQIQAESTFNMLGVNSALQTGRNINTFNQNISGLKGQMADVQADMATNQGIASLGGAVMKAGPIVGQLGKGFGSFNIGNAFMGGGSPSGYGN